jgi:hypothetical protein
MSNDNAANAQHKLREFINLVEELNYDELEELRHRVRDMSSNKVIADDILMSVSKVLKDC